MSRISTRDRILTVALRLFNEEGYSHVSMRQIAAELDISVGNLTYHFAKKRDIAYTLMDENFQLAETVGEITSVEQINALLSFMLDSLQRNAFFFLDEEFYDAPQHDLHHPALRKRLIDGLNSLAASGFFLPSFTPSVCSSLTEILLMCHPTWLRQSMRNYAASPLSKDKLLRAHWLVLLPYLSDMGREACFAAHLLDPSDL